MWGLDDAIERYKDISKFLILDPERPAGHQHHSFSREVEIFRERIRRYKDKRLKAAMDEAMARYYAWRQDRESKDEFKDKDYEVYSLAGWPSSAIPSFFVAGNLQPQIRILIPRYSSCKSCGTGFCVAIIADEGASFQKAAFSFP